LIDEVPLGDRIQWIRDDLSEPLATMTV
jgi:hypothetical protein